MLSSGYRPAGRISRLLLQLSLIFGSIVPVLATDITLAWDASTDPSVTGYRVYYGSTSRSYTNVVEAGLTNTLKVTGLTPGTAYYFAATAYNPAGLESAFSTEASVTLPAPVVAATVSAQTSRTGAGTVTGMGSYTNGSLVTLTAVASTGFHFVNWTENGIVVSTNPTITFYATADRNLVANFRGRNMSGDLDFNGDGKADLAAYDAVTGMWYIKTAGDYLSQNFTNGAAYGLKWGWSAAKPMRGDFDGDGKADIVVYDPSAGDWYIWFSGGSSEKVHWGWGGAIPVTGDFNGDGRTDLAAFDPQTGIWYIKLSGPTRATFNQGAMYGVQWGDTNTIPLCGDFDGDGLTDLVAYQRTTGDWQILFSSGGSKTVHWGWSAATPVPGDYNGDGRTDMAVYDKATGIWYVKYSGVDKATFGNGGEIGFTWGLPGMVPMPADYDGDGTTDLAVYSPDTGDWHIWFSRGGTSQVHWGWGSAVIP